MHKILEGAPPYDIFVRWEPLQKQPIGWDPDLNDGVRLNIRPVMSAADVGKNAAGILRAEPNIRWNKDRGTDVASAPWFTVFKGECINDHHLTLEQKRKTQAGRPDERRETHDRWRDAGRGFEEPRLCLVSRYGQGSIVFDMPDNYE